MIRRWTRPLLATAALVALAACAGAPAGDGDGTDSSAENAETEFLPPSELVGLWRVTGEGVDGDAWLQVGSTAEPGSLTYLGECGAMHGSWKAHAGAWLADFWGSSGSCEGAGDAAWIDRAASYGSAENGMRLLDLSGEEVAMLVIDGEPPANPELSDEYRQQPELSDEQLAELDAEPAPLPEGVQPATPEDLLGRWLPLEQYATDPFLEVADDGSWSGSDGCNGQQGRWALGAEGALLATAGVQTLVACEGHSLGGSLASAARLALDGDRLTFYDVTGEVIDEALRG